MSTDFAYWERWKLFVIAAPEIKKIECVSFYQDLSSGTISVKFKALTYSLSTMSLC